MTNVNGNGHSCSSIDPKHKDSLFVVVLLKESSESASCFLLKETTIKQSSNLLMVSAPHGRSFFLTRFESSGPTVSRCFFRTAHGHVSGAVPE